MNILVIGNGFDLAHGLKTSYKDFIELIKEKQYREYSYREYSYRDKNIGIKINKYIKEKNIYYKEFQECIKDNGWIKHFIYQYDKMIIGDRWGDFEAEISSFIEVVESIKINKDVKKEDKNIGKTIKLFRNYNNTNNGEPTLGYSNMIKAIDRELIAKMELELKKIVRALEIYLHLFVEVEEVSVVGEVRNINKVISFNYMNTYERLYDKNNKVDYDYIHGKVNITNSIESSNLVLGIDEYLEPERKDKNLDFIYFKKYFQRVFKRTGCKYKNWLEVIKEYKGYNHSIHIYGHSLAKSDKDILEELLLHNDIKIIIYYHSEEAYRSQITNLVSIIGQDNLIKKVYGTEPSIEFKCTKNKFEIIADEERHYFSEILS